MSETEDYARQLRWILSELVRSLEELDDSARSWRPLPSANDPRTIARHVLGSVRAYAVGIGGARPVSRDRDAEFVPAVDDAMLVDRRRELGSEIDDAFASIPDQDLDRPGEARAEWRGRTPPTGSRRDSILGAIRHAAIHLGELRLTVDLANAAVGEAR
jgi:DinB family protein